MPLWILGSSLFGAYFAAETDEEARLLATSQLMSFADIFRGARNLTQPPIEDIETYWTPMEKGQVMQMLSCTIVGNPETVRQGLDGLLAYGRF